MSKPICESCKKLLIRRTFQHGIQIRCKYGIMSEIDIYDTDICNFYEKKPESHEEQNKEVKELMTKAPKYPRKRDNVKRKCNDCGATYVGECTCTQT